MNYLAHIYLSGSNPKHAIGNFMADAIKGGDWKNYPKDFQKGILLHRAIDQFTDSHPLFRKHVRLLFPTYRHYSRVIVDMYYDHFLSCFWEHYHPVPLRKFVIAFHSILDQYYSDLPPQFQKRISILKREEWLLRYQSVSDLKSILGQMERRTRFASRLSDSVTELTANYSSLKEDFFVFFEALARFCKFHSRAGDYLNIPYFENLKNSER